MPRSMLTEAQIKKIVKQELFYRKVLEEGIWDDVKLGAKKLITAVTKKVSGSGVVDKVKQVTSAFNELPKEVSDIVSITKKAMKQTGESIKQDKNLELAKNLGTLSTDKVGAMLASDLKGPVHDKASKLTKENIFYDGLEPIINEITVTTNESINSKQLNEAGVIGLLGMGLAGFGGTIFVLSGLEKLAKFLGAEKTAHVLHHAHHVLHGIEEKAIDAIIPDNVSYLVYSFMNKHGYALPGIREKDTLSKKEFIKDVGGIKTKVEKLIYSAFLLFFAFEGIKAALHAGASLLGFAEGTASVIKGVEIGQAAAHIGDIIDLGVEELDDSDYDFAKATMPPPPSGKLSGFKVPAMNAVPSFD